MGLLTLNTIFPRTEAFERFIDPARDKPALWRLVLGFVIVALVYIAWVFGTYLMSERFAPTEVQLAMFSEDHLGASRATLGIDLSTFAGIILGLMVALWLLHRRGLASLFGPRRATWRGFGMGALVLCGVSILFSLPMLIFEGTTPHEPLSAVLLFLPVAAALLLVQTGAEELLFRGYMMQQLAVRFQSPWIWLVVPSLLFGLLHYDPTIPQVQAVGILFSITLTGFLWADLVRVTGNLGAAFGWHFANNFLLMNVVGFSDYLNGFAWRLLPFGYQDAPLYFLALDPLIALVTWGILRRVLRPKAIAAPRPAA